MTGGFDLHAIENLILLCRYHHGIADRFRSKNFNLRLLATLRPQLLEMLAAAEKP